MLRIRSTTALAGIAPAIAVAVGAASVLAVPVLAVSFLTGSAPAMASRVPAAGSAAARPGDSDYARPIATISGSSPRVVVSRHYGPPANASGYSVILLTGAKTAWAFGGTNPGGPSRPVAGHWNGSTMTPSKLPAGLAGFISDASAPSARDIWATSQYGGYVLHWNGRRWHVARRWRYGEITGLTAISVRNVWTFGTTASGARGTGTWHFDGTSWQPVSGPARRIYRASAVSGHDIWAITASPGSVSV